MFFFTIELKRLIFVYSYLSRQSILFKTQIIFSFTLFSNYLFETKHIQKQINKQIKAIIMTYSIKISLCHVIKKFNQVKEYKI